MKYNWEKWMKLGYSEEFLQKAEETWAESILQILTDEDLDDDICANVRWLLEVYSHEEVFLFTVMYTDAFMIGRRSFRDRIEEIKQKLGSDWDQILWEKCINEEESVFDAVGYLREADWREAIENL